VHDGKTIGLRPRPGPQNDGIDDGKEGGCRADAEREGQDNGHRRGRPTAPAPQGHAHVGRIEEPRNAPATMRDSAPIGVGSSHSIDDAARRGQQDLA
jgi:hypothetical protein